MDGKDDALRFIDSDNVNQVVLLNQFNKDQYIIFKFDKTTGKLIKDTFRFGGFEIFNSTMVQINDKVLFTGKSGTIDYGIGVINLNTQRIEFHEFKCTRFAMINIKGVNEEDKVAFWNDYTDTA